MATAALTVLGGTLLFAGLAAATLSLLGFLRLPSLRLRLHALSVGSGLGVLGVLAASTATGDWRIITRAALVGLFILVTAPVAAHAIARADLHRDD